MDNSIRIFDMSDSAKQVQNISMDTFESWKIDFGVSSGLIYTGGNNGTVSAIGYESGDVEFETRLSDEFHMSVKGIFAQNMQDCFYGQ
jgi:WD40 repeat protein